MEGQVPLKELKPVVQEAIAAVIKNEGYLTHNLKSKQINTNGGNYLGELYEIDINGKTKDGDKENNLFVKSIVTWNENFSDCFSSTECYITEMYAYKEMSKIFTKLQEKAGVPIEDRYKMVKGYSESSSEVIILDNAARKGFKCCHRMKVVPLKFAELSVQQLAKFHGLGFAIEKFLPDLFERDVKKLKYPLKFNEQYETFAATIANTAVKYLKEDLKEKARKLAPVALKKWAQNLNDRSSISTLLHGDFRANNILMREEDGEVAEVIPIDYQAMYYGCPANDLLYFIYGCTDREFRKQNMGHLIDLYFETLTNFLKYFDINVADVYPRAKLDEAIKIRTHIAVCLALNYFPVMFAPEDNVPDLGADSPMDSIKVDPEIVRRIEETLEDFNLEI